jgi:hypothetical protein
MPATSPAYDLASDEVVKTALANFQFFCEQRLTGVRSSGQTEVELRDFERRLPAYFDAIFTRGPGVIDGLLALLPSVETPAEICGIVVVLLESRDQRAADGVVAALQAVQEEPKFRGFQLALHRGPIDLLVPPLQKWLIGSDLRLVAIAAETLAYHHRISPKLPELAKLLSAAEPNLRRSAWRALALSQ